MVLRWCRLVGRSMCDKEGAVTNSNLAAQFQTCQLFKMTKRDPSEVQVFKQVVEGRGVKSGRWCPPPPLTGGSGVASNASPVRPWGKPRLTAYFGAFVAWKSPFGDKKYAIFDRFCQTQNFVNPVWDGGNTPIKRGKILSKAGMFACLVWTAVYTNKNTAPRIYKKWKVHSFLHLQVDIENETTACVHKSFIQFSRIISSENINSVRK